MKYLKWKFNANNFPTLFCCNTSIGLFAFGKFYYDLNTFQLKKNRKICEYSYLKHKPIKKYGKIK